MPDQLEFDRGLGKEVQTVSQYTRRVKTLLEQGLPPSWVRGEISNLRQQSSGHVYFSLKDAGAQISAVLFRGDALRQSVALRDGLQVVVLGELSVYEARGSYQLIVRVVIDDGTGRLQRAFEELKAKLADEGIFAVEKKLPLPFFPRTIGFITSPAGAAVQDFLRILTRREWRGRVVILPAKVQGPGAAAEIAELVRRAPDLAKFDLLVVGRGGGSWEDLWAFNEEVLVRAVASCPIPIISAVGHEIDFTLCDFAADVRAETPSGAAELISSQYVAAVEREERARAFLGTIMVGKLESAANRLDHARSRLRLLSPAAKIEQRYLRLDDLGNRMRAALRATRDAQRDRLHAVAARFAARHPSHRIERDSQFLLSLWKRLQAASPASVLNRGFAIVRDCDGAPLLQRAGVVPGTPLSIEWRDGALPVRAEGK